LIHSFADPSKAVVTHLNWNAHVDFDNQKIVATATYDMLVAADAERLKLDIRNLNIKAIRVDGAETKEWWIGPEKPFLGQELAIAITPESKQVSIDYETTEGAEALQWLNPQQTAGKEKPFLFTQSQAILARTWIPSQDSPGVRYTYEATVSVPKDLLAVMSASNPVQIDTTGVYTFQMNQPIPSYLMALSVGDLRFAEIGERTGVYAEPSILDAAAYEFEDMQKMLEAAEAIYGRYAWDRYDVLVLPPSFPFGGMENPRLTFATPTILAGDKSLTALVAHELAHSWSGNLVTNSTWNDFWLNEGFTVYFERRIMESVYGKDYANMLAILGKQDLDHTLVEFADTPDDTKLKLALDGRNPDDGMSDIAYEKGYLLLRTMEESVGREEFDAFLNKHFSDNAFKTIDTETFLENLKADLFGSSDEAYDALMVDQWVYEPGIPSNCVSVESPLFAQVENEMTKWLEGSPAMEIDSSNWTTHHWLHFLRRLPRDIQQDKMMELDRAFGFTSTGNSEIAAEWFVLSISVGYEAVNEEVEAFLISVGRRKFLVPIYRALIEAEPEMVRAKAIYQKARPNYHSVSTNTLDDMLQLN
jgi:aminopeptidase N